MLKKLLFACAICIELGAISSIQCSRVYDLVGTRYANKVVAELENNGKTLHITRGFVRRDSTGQPFEVIPDLKEMSDAGVSRYLNTYYQSNKNTVQKVEEIILPSTIKVLEDSCFVQSLFPNLKKIYIENPEQSKLEIIGERAFYNSPIEIFGEKMRDGQKSPFLQHIKNLTKIGRFAFFSSALKEFGLGGNDQLDIIIEDSAFYNCENLRFFVVYNNINSVSIGQEAFYDDSNLRRVNLTANTVTIGDRAFVNTNRLDDFCWRCNPRNIRYGRHVFDIGYIANGPGGRPISRN